MKLCVIFHVDETAKWNLLLKNVSNLINAMTTRDLTIEVLANAEAVKFYLDQTGCGSLKEMVKLSEKGVTFVACQNALNAIGIAREQLPAFVHIVPVGVLELMERQAEGYSYIKP